MKTYLKTIAITGVSWLAIGSVANAATIEGAINVDNNFVVVHSQGPIGSQSHSIIYSGANGSQWKKTERFKAEISDDPESLQQCAVNVIAWGDGTSRQGFAGVIKGNGGTVYTGGTGITAKQTSISSISANSTIGQTQVNSILGAGVTGGSSPYNISPGTVIGGTAPWGAMNSYPANLLTGVNASNFRWIWSTSNLAKRTYSVFNIPCGSVVKAAPTWKDMPGEHFQCYNLEKGDRVKSKAITIADQFGKSEVVIGRPKMLCNPSSKTHRGKNYRIRNKERHLVCYDYVKQNRVRPQNLKINNQFAPDEVVSTQREMFCVPSYKEHVKNKPSPKAFDRSKVREIKPRQQRR